MTHSDGSVVFEKRRAAEWRGVIYFEAVRATEGEKAGLSEGARPEIMSWGDTFGCDTFVYDPGKQSANDFLEHMRMATLH